MSAPPRLAERLLAALLGPGDRADEILGDLHEEHAARAQASPAAARVWYWMHALRIGARSSASSASIHLRRRAHSIPAQPTDPGDSLMRTLRLEIRHAARGLVKRPALSGIVVLTLALALGANAAVFGIVDALVFRPFPIPDVDRIAMLYHTRDGQLTGRQTFSPADFLDFRAQNDVFERFVAFQWWDANLVGRDEPEKVQGFAVSPDFFTTLGVQPIAGRSFLPDEETQGRHLKVILGYGLWQRRFAADSSMIGRVIQIDRRPYEVVGIAPQGFDFPMGAQLWAPLSFTPQSATLRRARFLGVIGKLAPGRSLDDAKAQAAVIGERLEREHPDTNRGYVARVYTLSRGMMDEGLGPILSMWQASAVFVLLIACANVANLLLARGAERQREMAVRLAIGASRARVVREMLIESLLLALAAVPPAIGVAWISLELLRDTMPAKIARFVAGWHFIDVDARLVGMTVLLAIGTAAIFGIVPALQGSRARLAESLKEGSRGMTGGSRVRLRRGLVMAEMALALPLLVASGMSAVTVQRFLNGPQGYDAEGVLSLTVALAGEPYTRPASYLQFATAGVDRLRAVPGVQSAAAVNIIPAAGDNSGRFIEIEGRPNPDPANPPDADFRAATPAIFETLGIPILRGRGITEADHENTQPIVIVSDALARRYWPGVDPIGRRMRLGTNSNAPWLTVVGVCGDVIHDWFARRNYPTVYRPFTQSPTSNISFVMKTAGDPTAIATDARTAMRAIDPVQPIFDVMPLRDVVWERTLGLRYIAAIMIVLGGLALALAIVGVYGVMAFLVTQRTHEIGVRIALGATRADVLRLTIGQTGRLTAVGVGLGLVLSMALMRLIEAGLLAASSDLRLVAGFASLLVLAALIAGYVPARRATTIDPMVALREQ